MANAPYLKGSGAVTEAVALTLRGIQSDQFGEILGGHKALFDFIQSGITGKPGVGAVIPNLVVGGGDGVVANTFSAAGNVETVKGLGFTSGVGEVVNLPSSCNLLNYGSEPSVVISTWLTDAGVTPGSESAIASYTYQNTSNSQWYIAKKTNGKILARVNGYGALGGVEFTPPTGPFLLTIHVDRTGSGTFKYTVYINGIQEGAVQSGAGLGYPFINPLSGHASALPMLGYAIGVGSAWTGVIHRLQLLKVPQGFDIASWIAAQLALNSGRFAV